MNDLVALPDTGLQASLPLWDPFLPDRTKWCWQGCSVQREVQHLGHLSKPLAELDAPLTVWPPGMIPRVSSTTCSQLAPAPSPNAQTGMWATAGPLGSPSPPHPPGEGRRCCTHRRCALGPHSVPCPSLCLGFSAPTDMLPCSSRGGRGGGVMVRRARRRALRPGSKSCPRPPV